MQNFNTVRAGTPYPRRAGQSVSHPLTQRRVGAVIANGFSIVAKLSGSTPVLRVSSRRDFDGAREIAMTSLGNSMFRADVSGLIPATTYYYQWSFGSQRMAGERIEGSVKTLAAGAHSFSFAFGGCKASDAVGGTFDAIRARNPAFLLHLGDLHYFDFTDAQATLANYRAGFDAAFEGVADFERLCASVPLVYTFSDHDYQINNVGGDTPGRVPVQTTYRQYFPHYPLAEGSSGAIYHSFEVGRVLFIMLDGRSYKTVQTATDNSSKTMLGSAQKTWLKNLLLANKTRPKILCHDGVWNASQPTNNSENWSSYATERTELVNFFAANGVTNMVMLSSDAHMCAADSGINSPGGIPNFVGGPFEHRAIVQSGPWSHGPSPAADTTSYIRQYGWIDVVDSGGSNVTVTYRGYRSDGTVIVGPVTATMAAIQ